MKITRSLANLLNEAWTIVLYFMIEYTANVALYEKRCRAHYWLMCLELGEQGCDVV